MQWTQVSVRTSPEAEEAVAHILLGVGAQGVVFGTDAEASVVTAYLSDFGQASAGEIQARVRALRDVGLDPGEGTVVVSTVDDEDWAESWKRDYRPLAVGRGLLVKPAWIDIPASERLVIELDPGMAFGTGYHPTTVLCMEALEGVVHKDDVVVDVGTGSGILSIAAARLGAASVIAVDTEAEAVQAARENSVRNGTADIVVVKRGSTDAARRMLGHTRADVVAVNIRARVIDRLAEELYDMVRPGGTMVAGGIIEHAADQLGRRLESVGFHIDDARFLDEWCCLIGRRPQ